MPQIDCANCGEELHVYKSRVNKNKNTFCNKDCYAEWRKGRPNINERDRVKVNCSNCDALLERRKSRVEKYDRQFCDSKCYGEWRKNQPKESAPNYGSDYVTGKEHGRWKRKVVECAQCGSELSRTPSQLKNKRNYFCDYECLGKWNSENNRGENHPLWGLAPEESPNWDGGHEPYYGASWKQQRRRAIERDGGECVICGSQVNLEVHHIVKFKKFGVENHQEANELDNLITLCQPHHREWEGIPLRPPVI